MLRKKRFLVAYAFLCLGCLLYSCSGEGLPKGKVYSVTRDPTWYPSNLMGKEKNMTAFSDDLLMTIARTEGIRFHINNSSPDALLPGLLNQEYEMILTQIPPTLKLQETVVFSNPYFLLGPVLVTQIDSPITSIEEMNGKTIGIEAGSLLFFESQKYPSIIVTTYNNIFQALGALDADKIDGVLMGAFPAHIYTKTFYPTRLRVATSPLTQDGLRLAALKKGTNEKLIKEFNDDLEKMHEDGSYDEMIKKWGLVNTSSPTS